MIHHLKRISCLPVLLSLVLASPLTLADTQVDRLVAVLVAKGMLSAEEAEDVLGEMQQLAAESLPSRPVTREKDRLRIEGDLRFRYQWDNTTGLPPESRIPEEAGAARYQARLGLAYDLDESWSVGLGVTSGGDNHRSNNQTFSNGFPTYDARIDYAYARFQYHRRGALLAGKFQNPVYTSANMLWDADIRPEGVVASYSPMLTDSNRVQLQGGMLILNDKEKDIEKDAYIYVVQAHWRWRPSSAVSIDLAPAYYFSSDLTGTQGLTDNAVPTNSRDDEGNLIYDYDAATVSAELSWLPGGVVDFVDLFGEYVYAPDPDEDNLGWLLGVRAGDARLERLGDWQLEYSHRRLEQDAWPEFLQDSDFLFGATSVKGHELVLDLAITPNVSIGIDYYLDNKVIGTNIDQDLLQVDLNLEW